MLLSCYSWHTWGIYFLSPKITLNSVSCHDATSDDKAGIKITLNLQCIYIHIIHIDIKDIYQSLHISYIYIYQSRSVSLSCPYICQPDHTRACSCFNHLQSLSHTGSSWMTIYVGTNNAYSDQDADFLHKKDDNNRHSMSKCHEILTFSQYCKHSDE